MTKALNNEETAAIYIAIKYFLKNASVERFPQIYTKLDQRVIPKLKELMIRK